MKPSKFSIFLSSFVLFLGLTYSALGLFWGNGGSPFDFATLRGETVKIIGQGIYQFDTIFFSAGFRGNDLVTIFLEVPLFIAALWLYHRGSLRGTFMLAGSLGYMLYNSFSMGTGAAYNPLFLLYTATFGASLFALGSLCSQMDFAGLSRRIHPEAAVRGAAVFLFIGGGMTALLWLSDILPPLFVGKAPLLLGPYTSPITYFVDLGVITPACILAGVWLLRRDPRGYLVGFILLYLLALMGFIVISQTLFQVNAGIVFSTGQLIGMIGSWIVMGALAIWFVINFLQKIKKAL